MMASVVEGLVVNAFKNAAVKLELGLAMASQEIDFSALLQKVAKQLEALREEALDLVKKQAGSPPPVPLEPAKTKTPKSTLEGLRK